MTNLIAIAALIGSVSLAIAQPTHPAAGGRPPPADDAATLQALEREWANAVVRRDTDTICRLQADDFEFTDPAGQVWTKTRALDFIKSGQLQIAAFEMTGFQIRLYGDTAIVNFRVVWTGKAGGNDISGPQRMTDVFVLRDGRWRCVSSHTTRILPAPDSSGGNG